MSFSVNNKVISYTDKIQDEYIIWFVDSMPKLYILAKSTKNFIIWYTQIAHLGYKNSCANITMLLVWMKSLAQVLIRFANGI